MSNPTAKPLAFQAGAHSTVEYAEKFLRPLFESGAIRPHPEADYYAICYSELCAYANSDVVIMGTPTHELLAVWSHGVPDCESDEHLFAGEDFAGEWDDC